MPAGLAASRSPVCGRRHDLRPLWVRLGIIYGRDRSAARAIGVYRPFSNFGQIQLVSLGAVEALLAPIYERVAVETPGMFARSSAWWQTRTLAGPEWRRQGNGDLQCA